MFKRFGENLKLVKAYTEANIVELPYDWNAVVHATHFGGSNETTPFSIKAEFDFDTSRFLYFRSRAITADIANNNGDFFPTSELEQAFRSFVGRGIYYNHNSDSPFNAFGVILDSAWSPQYVQAKHDPYVEILGAIDKELANQKYPFLLRHIEAGILNSTSMGCIAASAECSLCKNLAYNASQLCDHMNPDKSNPFYIKGKRINGSLVFESNFGITFTEDSIVNIPADPTARLLEIYASEAVNDHNLSQFSALREQFKKYTIKHGTKSAEFAFDKIADPNKVCATGCKCAKAVTAADETKKEGDFKKEVPMKSADKPEEKKAPEKLIPSDYKEVVRESVAKIIKAHISKMTEDQVRKELSDALTRMEQTILPQLISDVRAAVAEVKGQFPAVNAPKTSETPMAAKEEVKKAASIEMLEDFNEWPEEDRINLVKAVQDKKAWLFKGELK